MSILGLFIFFMILIILGKVFKHAESYLDKTFKNEYLQYGFLSRYYLSNNLKPSKFESWCKYVLEIMGYKNITNVSEAMEGGINLCSISKNQGVHISTRLYGLKPGETKNINDNYESIGRPEVQKFIGALVHDKIKNGVIITTGDFTYEAIEYIISLPKDYSITLIDGIALTKELRKIRKKEIINRITSGATIQEAKA